MRTRPLADRAVTGPDDRTRSLRDALVAAGVVGVFWVPPAIGAADPPRLVAGLVLASVAGAAMILRRRLPASSTTAAGISTVAGGLLGVCHDPMLATAWCLYALAIARASRTRAFVLVLAGALAALTAVTAVPGEGTSGAGQRLLLSVAVLSVAWLLGATAARQIAAAREAERARVQLEVARDVHDVVGHALGVIGAEAGVTRGLADAGEQELRDSLAGIEAHARSALEEMQGLVRTLRSSPAPPVSRADAGPWDGTKTPVRAGTKPRQAVTEPREAVAEPREAVTETREASTGIARLPSVIAATRAAGVDVEARIDPYGHDGPHGPHGHGGHVDPLAGAVVLRIVQEALSNVVRHAPGAECVVDVHRDGPMIVVRVRDHGPGARPAPASGSGPPASGPPGQGTFTHGTSGHEPPGHEPSAHEPPGHEPSAHGTSGFGLPGMRERARLAGGTVTWRDHPEGGFEVTARLPARGARGAA
ncbi:sensor histidine kinase [Streptosporangium sp. DT93]|uniref:sensor histidine kinase n=1 Tax=Streptosporangium sp. DT93 TaxID=3393428 RepID=UPI003CF7995C